MIAMMFGRAPNSLFGVYHPPRSQVARRSGIVLCYPFGQEYMRAHRAFRQLALLLSAAGFHVMRFDYTGTGDSSGDSMDASLAQWADDARIAANELKDSAELTRVSFVGLRLGAAVAALAAASRNDVDEVVLWDPPVDGAAHVSELLSGTHTQSDIPRIGPNRGVVGVFGFPVTPELRSEIEDLDLRRLRAPSNSGSLLLVSEERPEYGELRRRSARNAHEVVPLDGKWNEVDDYGGALIPVAQIRAIVAHLVREIP
jgi:pimeloyl-ACP methyl ester carboxylesterase